MHGPSENLPFVTSIRTESNFLRQNKKKITSHPWQVKSELQSYEPITFGPEYKHYETLRTSFETFTSWIGTNLGIVFSQEEKRAVLEKIYVLKQVAFQKYVEKNNDGHDVNTQAFVRANTREMVIQDVDKRPIGLLLWQFRHEMGHMLSQIRYVAKLQTRGHRRYYSEQVGEFGLLKVRKDYRHFFVALNEAVTETLNYESFSAEFKGADFTVAESSNYGLAMILLDVLARELARKEKNQDVPRPLYFRHMLYKDMLTGSRDFFQLIRAQCGGKALRVLATIDLTDLDVMKQLSLELCGKISSNAVLLFINQSEDFLAGKSISLLDGLKVKQYKKE